MTVGVCSLRGEDKHSGAHTVYHLHCVKPISVGVYNQEKRDWLILCLAQSHRACLYVCEVLAPADASEMELSGLRHMPGAKVKGHHIQTYPEKLSVREQRSLWDHLTNTLTRNIIYYPHPLSLISSFSQSFYTFYSPTSVPLLCYWKQISYTLRITSAKTCQK